MRTRERKIVLAIGVALLAAVRVRPTAPCLAAL